MSNTVPLSFVTEYESGVHVAYQQRGSKLRKTIRVQTNVVGEKAIFQKVGKGQAGKKTRHGNVPLMNLDHSTVTAILEDWYAAEYIDKLDQLKTKNEEMAIAQDAGGYALGRKIDSLIIDKLDGTSNIIGNGSAGFTKTTALSIFQGFNDVDTPDDGNRWCILGPHQWNEMMNVEEFKNSDYAGDKYAWLKGTESRTWMGINWMFHTGLPLVGGVRKCFAYHRTAAGLAEGTDVKSFIDWVPEKAAHLADSMLSAGAVLIDETAVFEIQCDDDAAIV